MAVMVKCNGECDVMSIKAWIQIVNCFGDVTGNGPQNPTTTITTRTVWKSCLTASSMTPSARRPEASFARRVSIPVNDK